MMEPIGAMRPPTIEAQDDHVPRRRLAIATKMLTVVVFVSFGLAAWSLDATRNATIRDRQLVCHAQNETNKAVRSILSLAQSISTRHETPEQRRQSAAFYASAVRLVQDVPCVGG